MMTTTMDLNGFNSSISGGIIGGLHLDKMGMASETDDLLDVWDSDLQQVRTIFKIICFELSSQMCVYVTFGLRLFLCDPF
jgi:hypothetical protein